MTSRLRPARTNAETVVMDLDAIIAEPVYFKWQGKVHEIKPISLKEFLKFTNANAQFINEIKSDSKADWEDVAEQYHHVISAVCDSITFEDILKMEQAQVGALYQLVLDKVMGMANPGGEKKKRVRLPIYESKQDPSSWTSPEKPDGDTKTFWSSLFRPFSFLSKRLGT